MNSNLMSFHILIILIIMNSSTSPSTGSSLIINKKPLRVCKSTYCTNNYNFFFQIQKKKCYKLKCSHLIEYSFECQQTYCTANKEQCKKILNFKYLTRNKNKFQKYMDSIFECKYMKKKTNKYEFIF
jgi:hypothetical protein